MRRLEHPPWCSNKHRLVQLRPTIVLLPIETSDVRPITPLFRGVLVSRVYTCTLGVDSSKVVAAMRDEQGERLWEERGDSRFGDIDHDGDGVGSL